jgi:molybdate transport system substrate-binding protein
VVRHRWSLLLLALLVVEAVACSNPDAPVNEDNPGPTVTLPSPGAAGGPEVSGSLVIYVPPELTSVSVKLLRGFTKQNPHTDVKLVNDPPRVSMLRILGGAPADLFISDDKSISDFRAYARNLPSSQSLAREALVIAVPKGNPNHVRKVDDLGHPPDPDVVCTPPYMLAANQAVPEDLTVPVNADSKPDCGETTVDQVATKALAAALVPGSSVGRLRSKQVDRVRVALTGNLVVRYSVVPIKDSDVAEGFVNFARSDAGKKIFESSGYEA